MGLFGWGKKPIAAEMAGRNLTAILINADDCWRDVCALRSYKTSGPIATCEMAFAHAALVKSLLADAAEPQIAGRALAAADALIVESFGDQDTDETMQHYGIPLAIAAAQRVSFYMENAWPSSQLASVLGASLGVSGIPSVEAAFIFENIEGRARDMLKKGKLV